MSAQIIKLCPFCQKPIRANVGTIVTLVTGPKPGSYHADCFAQMDISEFTRDLLKPNGKENQDHDWTK